MFCASCDSRAALTEELVAFWDSITVRDVVEKLETHFGRQRQGIT